MLKPLSYISYIKGNNKKIFSLIITIIFSILLIGSIHMFLSNSISLAKATYNQYNHFTFVNTKGKPLDMAIQNNNDIEKIIRVKILYVDFQGMAIMSSGEILITERDNVIYLLNYLGIKLNENEIPQNDVYQVILDKRLIINNDYDIGQKINETQDIKINDGFQSDFLIGFMPTNTSQINDIYKLEERNNGYLIIPKVGKLDDVNKYLKNNLDNTLNVYDKDYWNSVINNATGDIGSLFNIVTIIVLTSIGLGLGISTYVHYFQRRKEFGVLSSLGYSEKNILKRINKEIFYTFIIGFILSIATIYFEKFLINHILLIPKGIPVYEIDYSLFTRIIVIPLFTLIFSLVPTWILLRKLDSISIIEGEI